MNVHKPSKSFILAVAAVALLLPLASRASTGSIDATNKYAWGSNTGWVNFNPTNGNVAVWDAGLSGSAWGENYGWINLNPTASGVKNDGTGLLSGYAWGENTGYIDFSGVRINAQGIFTGTAIGDIVGSLTFDCTNCKVTTTWRPSTGAPIVSPTPPSVSVGGTAASSKFLRERIITPSSTALGGAPANIPPHDQSRRAECFPRSVHRSKSDVSGRNRFLGLLFALKQVQHHGEKALPCSMYCPVSGYHAKN